MKKYIKDRNYYGFVNELPTNDDRIPKFLKQRKEIGFDDTETWSLYTTIIKFILPRLKRFKEIKAGYPGNITEDEWEKILDKIILSFELILKEDFYVPGSDADKQIEEGLNLFREWFFNLWW